MTIFVKTVFSVQRTEHGSSGGEVGKVQEMDKLWVLPETCCGCCRKDLAGYFQKFADGPPVMTLWVPPPEIWCSYFGKKLRNPYLWKLFANTAWKIHWMS